MAGCVADGYEMEDFRRIAAQFDTLFSDQNLQVIKDTGNKTIARVSLTVGARQREFVLKILRPKGFLKQLIGGFGQSPLFKAWSMSCMLFDRGISIPKPVAILEERRRGRLLNAYYLSEFVKTAVNLKAYVNESGTAFLDDGVILKNLGHAIGKMHNLSLTHGDLKWSNILLQDMEGAAKPLLVDLDHARFSERLSSDDQAKDLARFMVDVRETGLSPDLSKTFLEAYFDAAGIADGQRDRFSQQMNRVVRKILERHKESRNNDGGEDKNNAP
jgi:tRNA A-37 threonylcarbamoyl transferase component Bud32